MSSIRRVYSPRSIRKNRRDTSRTTVDQPFTYNNKDNSNDVRIAYSTIRNNTRVNRYYRDYSPSTSLSFSEDYAPTYYRSTDIKQRIAPFTDYDYYLRYSPTNDESLEYQPILISRFRPQVLVTSNYGTLKDYYAYLLNLLSVLR